MSEHNPTTAAAPAAVEIDWIWGTPRGYIIRVEGHAFGPMSFNDLRHFPRWLFRRLAEVNDDDLDVALAVSRRLNDLKRGEWQRLLVKCDN
jgi:hypothetical protein